APAAGEAPRPTAPPLPPRPAPHSGQRRAGPARPPVRHRPRPAAGANVLGHEAEGGVAPGAGAARPADDPRRADEHARPDHARRAAGADPGRPRRGQGRRLLVTRPPRGGTGLRPRRHLAARAARSFADDARPARGPAGAGAVCPAAGGIAGRGGAERAGTGRPAAGPRIHRAAAAADDLAGPPAAGGPAAGAARAGRHLPPLPQGRGMTFVLIRKLLRDVRVPLLVVALLLFGFEMLWAKVTQRITEERVPPFHKFTSVADIPGLLFQGPGKLIQTIMGGERIRLDRAADMLSIGLVHPLTITVVCVWAVGRATGAIAGEIDRGTMELLLAQPLARFRLILAHLCVDLLTIPVLCLCLWAGNWLGYWLVGAISGKGPEAKDLPVQRPPPGPSR